MRKISFVTCLIMVLVGVTAFAEVPGDISVELNGGKNVAYIGETNTVEIWITNAKPLYGMTVGLQISSSGKYEIKTNKKGNPVVTENGDVVGAFDLGGLQAVGKIDSKAKDSMLIGGASLNKPFPAHKKKTLCYSFEIMIPKDEKEAKGGLCIDNIFYPPAGSWLMDEGQNGNSFCPTYQGKENPGKKSGSALKDADAPAVCFDIKKK